MKKGSIANCSFLLFSYGAMPDPFPDPTCDACLDKPRSRICCCCDHCWHYPCLRRKWWWTGASPCCFCWEVTSFSVTDNGQQWERLEGHKHFFFVSHLFVVLTHKQDLGNFKASFNSYPQAPTLTVKWQPPCRFPVGTPVLAVLGTVWSDTQYLDAPAGHEREEPQQPFVAAAGSTRKNCSQQADIQLNCIEIRWGLRISKATKGKKTRPCIVWLLWLATL